MKKTMIIGLALGVVAMAATSFAGASKDMGPVDQGYTGQKNYGGKGIVGSSHDMSNVAGQTLGAAATAAGYSGTGVDSQGRICVYCHHPHNAISSIAAVGTTASNLQYSPLWNRNMSQRSFTGYNNGSMMASVTTNGTLSDKRHLLNASEQGANATALKGVSLLCMSCHDGVVAMNAYSQTSGSTQNAGANTANGNITVSSTASFEGDMNNHHPMGFMYAAVQAADKEIAATTTNMTLDGTVNIGDALDGGRFECITCHDVHNTANTPNAERFLWRSNNKSNFCLTCHLK